MKNKYLLMLMLLAGCLYTKGQYSASNFTLVGQLDPETGVNSWGNKYSGCWGWYQASTNKEYAILGSQSGTYWVDVTNPATPTVSAYRAAQVSGAIWREIKTYGHYCYVVSDDFSPNNSLQIFDMQYLPDSVSKVYDSQSLFSRGHTLWVDGDKLYVGSVTYTTSNNISSMEVFSLANPANPVRIRRLNQDYFFINHVHDMHVRRDTVFASCGYQGLYMFKLTAAGTFSMLGSLTSYPFSGYNHSSSWTPNGQTLVFADEVPDGLPIKVADVSNLSNVQVLATTNQFTATTPHNPFVVNNQYCFVSSYQDGLQLYDISTPGTPTLAGYFDSYPQGGGNTGNWGGSGNAYNGQWGNYPYLPSKTIVALDMLNGLFLLKTAAYQNTVVASSFNLPAPCSGPAMIINTSTGATNYTWTLSGSASATSSAVHPTFTFSPGTYTLDLFSANPLYSASSTQTFTVNAPPQASLSASMPSCNTCNNGSISVTASAGISPYTYTWTPAAGSTAQLNNVGPGCYTVTVQDAAGCSVKTSTCLASVATGIAANTPNTGPAIYPNPAKNLLNIDYPGTTFHYSLINNLGQTVMSRSNQLNKATLHLDELAAGIYFMQVENNGELSRHKIIIQH